ncbi:hypothetical protein PT110_09635, partial [Erysipelothrix rhusiopathiae]|nr:hypothetical protein [Erysipelothrix rhusiopathiae]
MGIEFQDRECVLFTRIRLLTGFQDLNYRIERYHKSNDHYGLSDSDVIWLRFMFRFEMFELGSLR